MATLDDKLLGEKLHYYCSSSEDEGCDDEPSNVPPPPKSSRAREPYSTNTGPKGVLNDWSDFKRQQAENRKQMEEEDLKMMKKMSIQCQTFLEQEKEKQDQEDLDKQLDDLFNEDDPFMDEYRRKRMEDMISAIDKRPRYGNLIELETSQDFLSAIESEKDVIVICHISSPEITSCQTMNGCLSCLAADFPFVKFCTIDASKAGMSRRFEKQGVPALLVYKNAALIGNFVSLSNEKMDSEKEFGDDFFATDVESFLVGHGVLPDRSLIPEIIQKPNVRYVREGSDDDED